MTAGAMASSRLLPRDVVSVGGIGLRTRRLRAALSAVGIAIGIASMVAVLGISASSQADLLHQIDQLGTNLLTIQPGEAFFGGSPTLPVTARARIAAMAGVQRAASVYSVAGATVRRNPHVDPDDTSGIAVEAADLDLLSTLDVQMGSGRFLTRATQDFPAVVLGSVAAQRLALGPADGKTQVYLGGRYYSVIGVMRPVALDSSIDRAALIGLPVAERLFGIAAHPSTTYVRATDSSLQGVRNLLPSAANPQNPQQVSVSRPSDALEARAAAKGAFTSLLLALGAIALLVGGVGIANVMVISVLERRSEVGLRRALGATRRHIGLQFLTESLVLSGIGGVAGAILGAVATAIVAAVQSEPTVVPAWSVAAGVAAALAIGAVAGLYPAVRAARLSPTEALRTP